MYRSQKYISHPRGLIETFGWFGVVCVLLAYSLLSFSIVNNKSALYIALNVVGGMLLMIQSYVKRDYEPVVINIVWIMLSLIALLRII